MPGFALSNRCQFCKRRKIKCDENWPRCGNCKRSKQECSGPPKGVKFVQNKCQSAKGTGPLRGHASPSQARAPSPYGTLVDVKLQPTANGQGLFHQMKIVCHVPARPREVTPTSEERLAAKLSHCIASGLTGLLLPTDVLQLMSARLSESAALSGAVSCLLATVTNLKRGLPFQDLIDLQTYGRALKRLQKALKDPDQQFATATLAAVTVLYRIEVAYDSSKGPNKALHADAIYNMLSTRGPPSLDDMLDVHLAFENQQPMLSYTLLTNSPNFYADPTWLWTLQAALDGGLVASTAHASLYALHVTLAAWPSLASTLRALHGDPLNPFAPELAVDLLTAASSLSLSLQTYNDTVIASLCASGDIFTPSSATTTATTATTTNSNPDGELAFSSPPLAHLFATHAMASLATSSLIQSASVFLGLQPAAAVAVADFQNADWAGRIGRCRGYAVAQGPGAAFLVPALILAFGAAAAAEDGAARGRAMAALAEMEGWKLRLDGGGKAKGRDLHRSKEKAQVRGTWSEGSVLRMGVVLTGRGMFGVEAGEGREFWG